VDLRARHPGAVEGDSLAKLIAVVLRCLLLNHVHDLKEPPCCHASADHFAVLEALLKS
jgi:hypothetical protein